MKITVKPGKEVVKQISIKSLVPGTVFKFTDGVTGLKLENGGVVLLTWLGSEWFALADMYLLHPVAEVLGRVDEIIVTQ